MNQIHGGFEKPSLRAIAYTLKSQRKRIQNSEISMQLVGACDPPLIEDHQIENLVGA
ncbi:hypothetical protein [Nostoc sp. T09]|uniref:hypothetical protein n=1 Tax=Nostoc sp. T09 TaxID=1932621 RepID=UPI0015C50B5A|nr:hypothetical protein [Nostoc sp. T09]